jgi:hypothetical protein
MAMTASPAVRGRFQTLAAREIALFAPLARFPPLLARRHALIVRGGRFRLPPHRLRAACAGQGPTRSLQAPPNASLVSLGGSTPPLTQLLAGFVESANMQVRRACRRAANARVSQCRGQGRVRS